MCPVYPDLLDGFQPTSTGEMSQPDAGPQLFDFDTFVANGPDVLHEFDFSAFLHNDGLDICLPGTPECAGETKTSTMSIEMQVTKQLCTDIGNACLKKIVEIHKACKVIAGLPYPEILQNQLLTVSCILTKFASLLEKHHEIIEHTGSIEAITLVVDESKSICDRVCHDLPTGVLSNNSAQLEENNDLMEAWKKYIEDSEVLVYHSLVPLSKILRAFSSKSIAEQTGRLIDIAINFRHKLAALDDSKTEADDNHSILSGNTLIGIREAKVKGSKLEDWDVEDDDPEPAGCFFRIFFGSNRQQEQGTKLKRTFRSKMSSASSKFIPKKIQAVIANRQAKKQSELYERTVSLCTTGELKELTDLLARNPNAIESVRASPYAVLIRAAERVPEFLNCILETCKPMDQANLDGKTPLIQMVISRKPDIVKALLKAGADPHKADNKGRTALYYAASFGNNEMVNVIIAAGAKTNVADKERLEPLHIAAKKGYSSTVSILLKANADIEAPGPEQNKPLHFAAEHYNPAAAIATMTTLLNAGADINSTNLKLSTPLHWAIRFNRPHSISHLLSKGADIEALRTRWETPVKYAVSHGKLDILRSLLDAGANPDARTCEGKTALHSAAGHESHLLVKALLEAGCDVDPKGVNGSTPLYMAAQNGRIASAKLLVEAGADLKAERKGRSPLHTARKHGNLEVVKVLEWAERGEVYENDKVVEDHTDPHICTWEQWFERYIVATMDRQG